MRLVAATLRQARTASTNDWTGVCLTRGGFHLEGLEIYDRVGGGDSFASGLFYGLLTGCDFDRSLAYGVANGALGMTTPGNNVDGDPCRGRATHARLLGPGAALTLL